MANVLKLSAGAFAVFGVLALALALASPFLTAWAWNTIVPLLWKTAPHLTYWSALALNIMLTFVTGAVRGLFGRNS